MRQHLRVMNSANALVVKRASVLILAVAVFLLIVLSGWAQGVQHLSIMQPGGMPGMPVMTGIQQTTNGFSLTWDGPSGYYHLYQKSRLTDRKLAGGGQFQPEPDCHRHDQL